MNSGMFPLLLSLILILYIITMVHKTLNIKDKMHIYIYIYIKLDYLPHRIYETPHSSHSLFLLNHPHFPAHPKPARSITGIVDWYCGYGATTPSHLGHKLAGPLCTAFSSACQPQRHPTSSDMRALW